MGVFQKLNIFDDIGKHIELKAQQKLEATIRFAIRVALSELDKHAPIITDIIAARKVKLNTSTELQIEENPEDTL